MKILLLDVNYKSGSTGKIVYDLKQELEKKGHEVLACYGRGKKVEEKSVIKFSYDFETLIHAFLSRLTGLMGYFSYFSTKRLIKEIEKFKPDVVHIHETHSYFMNHLPLIEYLKKRNIKTVWTFHCEYMYTGNCGHAYDCNKWKDICENCPDIKRYPKSLFFDFNNIGNKKVILGVAPNIMSGEKGGKWMVKLAEQCLNLNYVFILIGVEDLTEKFPNNVIALGRTENQIELAEYYSLANIFLICSKKETFSMTCAEAISCGTPVIGFKSGAPETIFAEAIFVDYGDIKELKKQLEKFLNNQEFFYDRRISQEEIKKYSKNKMFKNYLNIYLN